LTLRLSGQAAGQGDYVIVDRDERLPRRHEFGKLGKIPKIEGCHDVIEALRDIPRPEYGRKARPYLLGGHFRGVKAVEGREEAPENRRYPEDVLLSPSDRKSVV
jgi:hypothetical protein